jgi:hypothetical protein
MYRPTARNETVIRRTTLALSLLSLAVLWAWMPVTTRAGSIREPAKLPGHLPSGSPSQRALLEAAFWWAQAVQVANDEYDDERAALQAWDPAVTEVDRAEQRRLLAGDHGGYLRRAWRAARRAAALAQTAREEQRAEQELTRLEFSAGHTRAAELW